MSSHSARTTKSTARTIDALILPFLVDVVEISKHLYRGEMGSRIIYNSFAAVLNDVF